NFMSQVFEQPFEVVACAYEDTPAENENPKPLGRHLDGCRIGFDAGGSDRKVSAVIDGEPVYSEEVIWHPKTTADAQYHYDEIVSALKTAASKMPRVDAIGVSSAGIYINNQTKIASLFRKVPADQHEAIIKNIYINAAKEIGDIPVEVANDGDVTALAGSMSLNDNNILGIAMGTSQAGGYVDGKGYLTGWLNELAFTPIDATPNGPLDEWSGDIGCGVMYFSQDGVIRLAPLAGVELDENATPAEKLAFVQEEVKKGNENADKIFEAIGVCLGHAVAQYSTVYDIKHVLLMGRVVSGKGGQLILDNTNKVLAEEYPAVAAKTEVTLPDEKSRRVGQSVAAASLPSI
ncbi:MAG TPA: ROK family protein, partial [Oscillospiraceae bacterium]|nr:ROK family protein [Oscillospiraceae bacterium]